MFAEIEIVFGWELDGMHSPEATANLQHDFGRAIYGPKGLKSFLDNCLGLSRPALHSVVRIAELHSILLERNDGKQFFSKSFSNAPWETSKYLLSMRDELKLAGWSFAGECLSPRLAFFAAVEPICKELLSFGFADSMRELIDSISGTSFKRVVVSMLTPICLLPKVWREVFCALAKAGAAIIECSETINIEQCLETSAKSDLHELQDSLTSMQSMSSNAQSTGASGHFCELNLEQATSLPCFRGDGSVLFLESATTFDSALLLASLLSGRNNQDIVIVKGSATSLLDETLSCAGIPRLGGERKSKWRGAVQVLPLAFAVLWSPVNISSVMELLALSQSPIPSFASYCLLEALREEPGFGGIAWSNALATVTKKKGSEDANAELSCHVELSNPDQDLNWMDWVNFGLYKEEAGIPSNDAIAICERTAAWASSKYRQTRDDIYKATESFALGIAKALHKSGISILSKALIERVLEDGLDDGVSCSAGAAQASDLSAVDSAGQIWEPVDEVIWWGFFGGEERGSKQSWNKTELQYLQEVGICFETPSEQKARMAFGWRQAILNARSRVVFIRSMNDAGRKTHPHPFLAELSTAFDGPSDLFPAELCINFASISSGAPSAVQPLKVSRSSIKTSKPPQGRPFWSVRGDLFASVSHLTYSSIDSLIRCPLSWLLAYPGRIRNSAVLDVPRGDRLMGNVAHKLVESIFYNRRTLTVEDAISLFEQEFEPLVSRIAIPLLETRNKLSLARFRTELRAAIRVLVHELNNEALGVEACETERMRTHPPLLYADLPGLSNQLPSMKGILDLLCKDSAGNEVIIDLKWTRNAKYRAREISEGRELQLAYYSFLNEAAGSSVSLAGYFMLKQARFLFSSRNCFKRDSQQTLSEVWRSAFEVYEQRVGAIACGTIEATGFGKNLNPEMAFEKSFHLPPLCNLCVFSNICAGRSGEE